MSPNLQDALVHGTDRVVVPSTVRGAAGQAQSECYFGLRTHYLSSAIQISIYYTRIFDISDIRIYMFLYILKYVFFHLPVQVKTGGRQGWRLGVQGCECTLFGNGAPNSQYVYVLGEGEGDSTNQAILVWLERNLTPIDVATGKTGSSEFPFSRT